MTPLDVIAAWIAAGPGEGEMRRMSIMLGESGEWTARAWWVSRDIVRMHAEGVGESAVAAVEALCERLSEVPS